jgi:eukaryotic-like serine/threonine-protein kinase
VWYLKPTPAAGIVRFQYAPPPGLVFAPLARHFVNISPDGTQVVYGTNRGLYVRRLSEFASQPVPETAEAGTIVGPAFSPDGRAVAFWADGTIKRVPVDGGPSVALCAADNPFGLSWGETGIVFAQAEKATIMRVSPNGGAPEVMARARRGELVSGPELLPGGRFVLFSVTSDTGVDRWDRGRIVVQALGSDEPRVIVEGGSDARYLPTGHLVYAAGGVLFAAPFDATRAELEGPAVPVLSGVRRANPGVGKAHYAVSNTGTIVYLPGPAAATAASDLALADRDGTVTPLNLPLGAYGYPRVSPNGRRLAFTVISAQDEFIALLELSGGKAMRRLTLEGRNRFPVWASDGQRIAYQSDREGDAAIFWQPADGSGTAERLTKPGSGESHAPESWSPTTDTLIFSVHKDGEHTLWTLSLPDKRVTPVGGVSSTIPINAVFSPDGRWMAYQSDQSGRPTVYVQPVPATGAVYQFLPRGADQPHEPMWSPTGKELFYNPRAGGFEVVAVTTEPEFEFGNPVVLPRPFLLTPPQGRRSYDVTADGRIVALVVPEGGDDPAGAQRLDVVVNWSEELKQRVPRR